MSEPKLDHLGILEYFSLESEVEKYFPSSWPQEYRNSKGNADLQSRTRFVGVRCNSEIPTEGDISNLVSAIAEQHAGNIDGWLLKMGYIMIPSFEDGDEPSISDYLREDFDQSRIKTVAMLISYPIIKA